MKNVYVLFLFLMLVSFVSEAQYTDRGYGGFNITTGREIQILGPSTAVITGQFFSSLTGEAGKVLKTINGGVQLTEKFSGGTSFEDVFFYNADTGYVAGNRLTGGVPSYEILIGKTTDGGESWTIDTTTQLTDVNDIFFITDSVGFFVGDSGIFRTTNAADTLIRIPGSPIENFIEINFSSDTTGYVVAFTGELYKTTDGGDTWQDFTTNLNYNDDLQSVYFIDDQTGFVVPSAMNFIFRTEDGGESWTQISIPGNLSIFDITFTEDTIGYISGQVGNPGSEQAVIFESLDKGMSWTSIYTTSITKAFISLDVKESFLMAIGQNGYTYNTNFAPSDPDGFFSSLPVNILVGPNPSPGNLQVFTDEKVESIEVVNLKGEKEIFRSSSFHTRFKGLVLVIVNTASGSYGKKVVIE